VLRSAARPLLVAGGGVIYAGATHALAAFAAATGFPVAETTAGMGSLPSEHPSSLGGLGVNGNAAANGVAADCDVLVGIGTRWSDVTTASQTLFRNPDLRVMNVNIDAADAAKLGGRPVVADALETLRLLQDALEGHRTGPDYVASYQQASSAWAAEASRLTAASDHVPPTQAQVIGALSRFARPQDVVVAASGSLPNDLHKLWRNRDAKGYHVEYGYSCMGYEIAGALGVRLADPARNVYALVGDGAYLMMPSELVTCVQENVHLVVILVDNHGFASVGALSRRLGSDSFGTRYRSQAGDRLPVDLALNAESLGAHVLRARTVAELEEALKVSGDVTGPVVIHVETEDDKVVPRAAWWDVHVAEVSESEPARQARRDYEASVTSQRRFL
jgi:3D-(3,5/4)-trihydroxycyclohexane-1,2-dione acylhydrolase (decyclizing)